jgi:hypothetical protein
MSSSCAICGGWTLHCGGCGYRPTREREREQLARRYAASAGRYAARGLYRVAGRLLALAFEAM